MGRRAPRRGMPAPHEEGGPLGCCWGDPARDAMPCSCTQAWSSLLMASTMMFPKPPPRRLARARASRAQRRLSAAGRADLVRRDHVCRVCGDRFAAGPQRAEAHHVIFRSQGGETSTQNMVLLCTRCHHQAVHGHRIDLVPVDPARGADGPLTIRPRPPKRAVPRQSVRGAGEKL